MRRTALALGLPVLLAGTAFASWATGALSVIGDDIDAIIIVGGRSPTLLALDDVVRPVSVNLADDGTCVAVVGSAGSTGTAPGVRQCGAPSRTTLEDRVYFGAYWQILDREPATAAIPLGGGYTNTRVERTAEGDFFAGIVEKLDGEGGVTDVILAFAGAHGLDAVQGESILLGIPLDEAARATALYDALLADPRYAGARIHVTGHSLGAGYTQFVLAHALARHGPSATDRRADFLAFGAPNWVQSAARHFGVDPDTVASRMVDFTAANDPVRVNGVIRLGINNELPAFTGLSGLNAALNPVASHWPTTYASALGLPVWLSVADRDAATRAVSAQFTTGDAVDPSYGPTGSAPLTVDGSDGREWLQGMAGADRLTGRRGADILTGDAGADRFVYKAAQDSSASLDTADRISDFSQAEGDLIDFSSLSGLFTGGLRFVGGNAFSGKREVRYAFSGGETVIAVDMDADRTTDILLRLDGRIVLRASDFVLL